jgi:hypothetical protein
MCVRRVSLEIVVMFAGIGACASLAHGQVAQIPLERDSSADILFTIQARKLLMDDPDLAALNIGVMVRNRVATLWGPVPSVEAIFRAELCLRTMVEVMELRNDLFVTEPLEPIRPPLKIENKPLFQPDQLPPKLPREPRSLFGATGRLTGHDLWEAKHKSAGEIKVLSTENRMLPTLGSPQPALVEEKAVGAEEVGELAAAVRQVLQSKPYRDIQFAVKEGQVYLRSVSENADGLQEAARAISRLPNVVGVVLLEKASPR